MTERNAVGTFREDRRAKAAADELAFLAVPPPNWLCSICRDVVQHDPVCLTACGHSFCRGCLMRVLSDGSQPTGNGSPGRGRCPMCRAAVPSADAFEPNESAWAASAVRSAAFRSPQRAEPCVSASQSFAPNLFATVSSAKTKAALRRRSVHTSGGSIRRTVSSLRCRANTTHTVACGAARDKRWIRTWRRVPISCTQVAGADRQHALQSCTFHALRSYLNKTNQQLHHVRLTRGAHAPHTLGARL